MLGYAYDIKFMTLPSNDIFNPLKPKEKIIEKLDREIKFFKKLEHSILQEGIRNPIVVHATKDNLVSRYGGSRLWISQQHNLDIPCIVADFDNIYPEIKNLETLDEIYEYYQDRPRIIRLKPYGINISGCEHVHLKVVLWFVHIMK